MKKVLVIANNNLGIGGIQSVIMSIVRNLGDDFQFDIVVFNHEDTYYEDEFKKQGRIFTIPQATGPRTFRKRLDFYIRPFSLYKKICAVIQNNGPYDVIHCHNYFEEGVALYAAKRYGIRVRIAHSHSNMPTPNRKIVRRIYQCVYRKMIVKNATQLVACSKAAAQYLYGKTPQAEIIYNAINVQAFNSSIEKIAGPWTILHVGRWGNPKNQSFLIEVFSHIVQRHPNAMLRLVGGGDEKEKKKIDDVIEKYKLGESVKFLPADSNIPEIMSESNVFVFPSIFEGLGIVLIEAQASGMKCFASDTVPKEANLGLVDYISLSKGPEAWAKKICEFIEGHGAFRKEVDMSSYDIFQIKQKYKAMYNGEGA